MKKLSKALARFTTEEEANFVSERVKKRILTSETLSVIYIGGSFRYELIISCSESQWESYRDLYFWNVGYHTCAFLFE